MTMSRLFLCALLAVGAAQSARANCGNDKPVGTTCGSDAPVTSGAVIFIGNDSASSSKASAQAASNSVSDSVAIAQGGAGGMGGTGGTSSSSVVFSAPRNPVAMAYAPPVQATATCVIPLSAGLSFVSFGGSFGTAYVDANCALLEQVRAVAQLGDTETAFEMLCSSKAYATARERQGRPCRK